MTRLSLLILLITRIIAFSALLWPAELNTEALKFPWSPNSPFRLSTQLIGSFCVKGFWSGNWCKLFNRLSPKSPVENECGMIVESSPTLVQNSLIGCWSCSSFLSWTEVLFPTKNKDLAHLLAPFLCLWCSLYPHCYHLLQYAMQFSSQYSVLLCVVLKIQHPLDNQIQSVILLYLNIIITSLFLLEKKSKDNKKFIQCYLPPRHKFISIHLID